MLASLLWGLIVLLVVLWLFGFLVVHVGGTLIHLLLAALVVLIFNLLSGRRAV